MAAEEITSYGAFNISSAVLKYLDFLMEFWFYINGNLVYVDASILLCWL